METRQSVSTTISSNENGGGLVNTRNIKSMTSITEESVSASTSLSIDNL
jgi:hypothetical protein